MPFHFTEPRLPRWRGKRSTPAPRLLPGRRRLRRSTAVLPTLFTLGNAICGFVAIFLASRPEDAKLPWNWTPLTFAALCVFLGMLFDALDGRIARLTHHTSDLGAQLDSMSDMVSFGVAPAFIAVQLVLGGQIPYFASNNADTLFGRVALVAACIYVACTALRLARFNVECHSAAAEDHMYFKGLPSPGAAGTVVSLVLLHQHFLADFMRQHAQSQPGLDLFNSAADTPWSLRLAALALIAVMLLVAFAMVSRLRYVHAANRWLRGRATIPKVAKIMIAILLLAVFPQQSLAAAFVFYALSAPVTWLWDLLLHRRGEPPATPPPPPQA